MTSIDVLVAVVDCGDGAGGANLSLEDAECFLRQALSGHSLGLPKMIRTSLHPGAKPKAGDIFILRKQVTPAV